MQTNDEIKKKALAELYDARAEHNKRVYTSQREKVIDKMLDAARAAERQKVIKILDDLWSTEATKINSGVYAYPFEAMRDMIITALNKSEVSK